MSSRRSIDELLAPDRLSGRERERALAIALRTARVAGPRPWWRRSPIWSVSAAALAAAGTALVLFVARPALDDRASGRTIKGAGEAGKPLIELVCSGGTLARCPRGSTLLFRIDGLAGPAALTAWAEPAGETRGERIWYFSADDRSPPVATTTEASVLRRGIRVGVEHAIGTYDVHVLLTSRALSRQDALGARGTAVEVRAETSTRIEVVP